MSQKQLQDSVLAIMAARRRADGDHASPDDLVSYHAGELAKDDETRVRRHLAICPDCAWAVLDMASFPDVPARNPATAEIDVSRHWQRFQERLQPQKDAPVAAPTKNPWRWWDVGSLRFAQAMAVLFALATVGLLLVRPTGERRSPEPHVNVVLAELVPASETAIRDASGDVVRVPASAEGILLTLALADPRPFPSYEIDLRDAERPERLVWTSGVERAPEGFFTVELPRGFVTSGRWRLEVKGRDGGEWVVLATYVVVLEVE